MKNTDGLGNICHNDNNIISAEGISQYLINKEWASRIYIFKELESTNITAKEMARKKCEHGTVIIADSQTGGKGVRGKSFLSLPGSGVYMSIVLHTKALSLSKALITPAAAVAVCKAINIVTGKQPDIKWVNDVFLGDKKICGILSEAMAVDFARDQKTEAIIVGIGINVNTKFPEDLNQIAGSIFPEGKMTEKVRNKLIAEIINIFMSPNKWLNNDDVYSEYKSRLNMLGAAVEVIQSNSISYEAFAVDIDKECHLIVKKADGALVTLTSGEVSARKI